MRDCVIAMNNNEPPSSTFIHDKRYKDTKNKNYPKLYLSGEQLKYKKACKFLGITFDETLTFENHIENIATRAKNV